MHLRGALARSEASEAKTGIQPPERISVRRAGRRDVSEERKFSTDGTSLHRSRPVSLPGNGILQGRPVAEAVRAEINRAEANSNILLAVERTCIPGAEPLRPLRFEARKHDGPVPEDGEEV